MIGIIVAMRREAQPLLRLVGPSTSGTIAGLESRCFTVHGNPCILVYSGVGMERARTAAAAFIRAVSPSLLVSFGISGGVEEDLQAGDVAVPETSMLLGAEPAPLALAALSAAELAAVERAVTGRGAALHRGSIITTRGETVRPGDVNATCRHVLDMETYAIAEAAARQGVPLASLRGLSDSFREPLPFDLAAMTDPDGNFRTSRLLGQALRRPGLVRRLSQLQANTRRAEENVTAAVMALLACREAPPPST